VDFREIARPPHCAIPRDLLDRADTLLAALTETVQRFPDYQCLTLADRHRNERHLTLAQLWQGVIDVHKALLDRGLTRGGRVIIVMPTGPELLAAYFGVMRAGGIPALLATPGNRTADHRVYTQHVGAILQNAQADVLYTAPEVAELFRGENAALLGSTRALEPSEIVSYRQLPEPVAESPQDIATIQYSSGSTAAPKGVLLSHGAILDNLRQVRDWLGLDGDDVTVNWIPLYHDMGLIDGFLLPLLSGCPTVLIPTMDFMRDPSLWLWAIHRYRGAHSWAPNFAYALCATRISDQSLSGLDLSSWRIAVSAAEPILASTLDEFTRRFSSYGFDPRAFTPMYGLAENVTAVTAHPVDEPARVEVLDRRELALHNAARPTAGDGLACVSVGKRLPGYEVEIREPGGARLPDRSVGVIWVRTPALFKGYHRDPEATRLTLVDGWLDTGDRGYMAEDHLFFISRDKDLIVIGGEKYAPHDVEAAVNRVPGVRQGCAIAFGVMNRDRGTEELVIVAETRREDPEALATLTRAIRREVIRSIGLGVRHVKLVPAGGVEKTTSGKLARAATRRRYLEVLDRGR